MNKNKIKWFFEKSKYYIITVVLLVGVLISSIFMESEIRTVDKATMLQHFIQEFWVQILIGAFIITISISGIIQFLVMKNMQEIKEERSDIKEKAEIRNMRYGVRR